jgi:hypothetical protein
MTQTVQIHRPESPEMAHSVFVECDASADPQGKRTDSVGYVVADALPHGAGRPPMRSELTR